METSYQIRSAYRDDWQDAMGLAWKTFLRFEADVYTAEGVKNFENFITDSTLYRMFIMGAYQMFVAVADGGIVGMITLRDSQHISLLFVDERYHRQGIGRALLSYLTHYMGEEMGLHRVTVNASPYGVGFITGWAFVICAARSRGTASFIRPWNLIFERRGYIYGVYQE